MNKLTETFCEVDDFCKHFLPLWEARLLTDGTRKRRRKGRLSFSEIMTIIIHFHQSKIRDFKTYYTGYVRRFLTSAFPNIISYSRFVELIPSVIQPLTAFFTSLYSKPTGISFIDSTKLEVCHVIRAKRNKVFKGVAAHGQSSMGWFYGFKLHLIINHKGEIINAHISEGNKDDRAPLEDIVPENIGKLYGDKGYLGKSCAAKLKEKGCELITNVRKNMKKQALPIWDKIMLRKRFLIETVNGQLKEESQIEHTRHRSITGFMANVLGGLIAYCLSDNKPTMKLSKKDLDKIKAAENLTC